MQGDGRANIIKRSTEQLERSVPCTLRCENFHYIQHVMAYRIVD